MNSTPSANRPHIVLYGNRNSGKSSLLNAIIGQEISLVSDIKGTTTDPVTKSMELIPLGPVVFIDTAGLDDMGTLGELRVKRTLKILQRTDFAIYVMDGNKIDKEDYKKAIHNFKKFHIPYMTVINKIDRLSKDNLNNLKKIYPNAIFVSAKEEFHILELKDKLIEGIHKQEEDPPIVGDLVPYNGTIILVVPIDSEAPKGRIILPQVQVIRDALDHGIKSYVVRDTELSNALKDLNHVDLVITDSQAFNRVDQIVPNNISLTSFSILFARYKGDLNAFIEGIHTLEELKEGSKILISESCTHNHSHEDIGRVKIPNGLERHLRKNFDFTFRMGHDFPNDVSKYDLIIHCGSCMVNSKTMSTRIQMCREQGVPITNYGMVLAYLSGILKRSMGIFKS
ncbi:[FeFe] hydrogenase H-cluster maturation GTPase HydF [Clostridiisalibacter paucivorans]|uniref:[FeFe] hydrogenase H-cluster maturation GTPase HydF n=1 Tax=Clostridiisalibacter paucivorans TaxID=408753 RepID=UPI00047C67F9|nr:[FeFe] hydrogenase H-cluster maturation GTPase HydF [Clostridiisalibacter paucivorans]